MEGLTWFTGARHHCPVILLITWVLEGSTTTPHPAELISEEVSLELAM